MKNHLIVRDPEILSGIPVFCGTRVPIQNLIDYLEAGDSLEEFLDDFPTVKKEDALKFLESELDSGDYTKDRHQWLNKFTVDDIFNLVQEQRKNSWQPNFFEDVIGGWEGEKLVRDIQPDYETREELLYWEVLQ